MYALQWLTILSAVCFFSGYAESMPYSKSYKRYINNLDKDQNNDNASLMRVFKRGQSNTEDENVKVPDNRIVLRIIKRQQKLSKKKPDEVVVVPFSTLFPHN